MAARRERVNRAMELNDYDQTVMQLDDCQAQAGIDPVSQSPLHLMETPNISSNPGIDLAVSRSPSMIRWRTEQEELDQLKRDMITPEISSPRVADEFGLPHISQSAPENVNLALFRLGSTRPGEIEDDEEMRFRLQQIRTNAVTLPMSVVEGVPSEQLSFRHTSHHKLRRYKGAMRTWCAQKKWVKHQRLKSTPGTFTYATCQFNDCSFVIKVQQANQDFQREFTLLRNFGGSKRVPVLYDAWQCDGLGYLILGSRMQ